MKSVSAELQVPFHDVDMGCIVWHGHFLKYFEIGRTELMRACDLDVPRLMELQARMVVSESRCRHHAPLHYGDHFTVTATFGLLEPALEVLYTLTRADGVKVARGRTVLACVTEDASRMAVPPPVVLDAIRSWQAR